MTAPANGSAPGDLCAIAETRAGAGDVNGALAVLDEVLRQRPDDRRAILVRTKLLLPTNPIAAADTILRITRAAPDDAEAWGLMGQALSAAGRGSEAVIAFRRAADRAPGSAGALCNLAIALLRIGDGDAARSEALKALEMAPSMAEAHSAFGHAMTELKQPAEAIAAFQKALTINPRSEDALTGIARAYRELGRPSTAIIALQRAVNVAPRSTKPLVDLASLYREVGDLELASETGRRALSLSPGVAYFSSNLLLDRLYDPDDDVQASVSAALEWGIRQTATTGPLSLPPGRNLDASRPLRIGYVSADLYGHPVGWLGGGAIAAHDKNAFHVTIYANQWKHDHITERIRDAVDSWVPVVGLEDASIAQRIVEDRIDILVDLSGHTAGHRLAVFARRPAPIQVSWLGYPGTTGLPTMDYIVMDDAHLPAAPESLFTERIIRLPRIRFGYTPPAYAPAVTEPPRVRKGYVTFASFNNISKLNGRVIELWSRVLQMVPDSRLLLKWRHLADPYIQERIRHGFARHGIAGERIVLDGASPHEAMLAQYGEVDIALDPFPFCGGLTSCEALWMGVPVVTLPGTGVVSRQTDAILHSIGRSEWSASSPERYVAIARKLAGKPRMLGEIRTALRASMLNSPLCDATGLARSLEAAYRTIWRRHVAELTGSHPPK